MILNKFWLIIIFVVVNMSWSHHWRLLLKKGVFVLTSKRGELPPTAAELRLCNSDNNSENSVFRFWRRAASCFSVPVNSEFWTFCFWFGIWQVARRCTSSWTHVSLRRNWNRTTEGIAFSVGTLQSWSIESRQEERNHCMTL